MKIQDVDLSEVKAAVASWPKLTPVLNDQLNLNFDKPISDYLTFKQAE